MTHELPPGANMELPAHVMAGMALDVLIHWVPQAGCDLDIAALAVATDGRVSSDADLVFFNNPVHPSGAVTHLGQRNHNGRQWDGIRVNLRDLPLNVDAVSRNDQRRA